MFSFLYLQAIPLIIAVICIVVFKRNGNLSTAAKGAFASLFLLIVICFGFGLFNRFSFLHGSSPAGVESGFAYAFIGFFLAGPVIFVMGGLLSVGASKFYKSKKLP
jgi:hypothetical protein